MAVHDFRGGGFDQAAYAAGHRAFSETLAAGSPVFYMDEQGLNVLERPDGRRFEIRWLPGAAPESNYQIVRELKTRAA